MRYTIEHINGSSMFFEVDHPLNTDFPDEKALRHARKLLGIQSRGRLTRAALLSCRVARITRSWSHLGTDCENRVFILAPALDLRTTTRAQVLAIADLCKYGWRPYGSERVWPAAKLRHSIRLIDHSGGISNASWGDYIVRIRRYPMLYGRLSHLAHEMGNCESVYGGPPF